MRVLFADKLADHARTALASAGLEVRADPSLTGETLESALSEYDPDVLVVRSTKVGRSHIDSGKALSLVVRAGAGVNTIDLGACAEAGVFVANCPGRNAVAVAELTLALVLAIDRQIADNVKDLRAGRWDKQRYSKAGGLNGRTLGLIGLGNIGKAVAQRAQAFGMQVLAWSRSLDSETADALGVKRYDTPEDVARRADVVSVHLALTPETRGLIGRSVFNELRHGAMFINTSRAEVVDEGALLHALDHKEIRAGLDVFSNEPSAKTGTFMHPLAQHASVTGTHHIGASTEEAQISVADAVVEIVRAFHDQGRVLNCVNLADKSAATHCIVVRHRDRVGVLASVLAVLRAGGINVQEMDNTLFAGGLAASARIRVVGEPSDDLCDEIVALDHVLHASAVALSS
ncbi:MAG: D-3-phosphoglycerate dehydrogenase [Myxococcota bacterium]|jgi:D-3-phosphoglycerate dehydrogenase